MRHNHFFFNDTATTEIYTLSLHDALPILFTLSWDSAGLVQFVSFCRARIVSGCGRSEEHTSELQSRLHLVCRLLLEKKKKLIISAVSTPTDRTHYNSCYTFHNIHEPTHRP